jgi:hypothetical protein
VISNLPLKSSGLQILTSRRFRGEIPLFLLDYNTIFRV